MNMIYNPLYRKYLNILNVYIKKLLKNSLALGSNSMNVVFLNDRTSLFEMNRSITALENKSFLYKISRRTMMRSNTVLTLHQIKSYSRILYYHNKFLKNVVEDQGKNENNFIEYALIAITSDAKIFQHFLTVAYPNKTYSYALLSKKFPEIIIDNGNDVLVNNTTLITTLQTALLKKQELFKLGTLKAIMARENQIILHTNSKEFEDTGQQNPDAEYVYIFNSEKKIWKLHRFIDFKSGENYNVNKSNILGTSDRNYYEELSEKLMRERRTCYKDNYEIKLKIENLRKDNTLSWGEKNNILQKYFMDYAYKFPDIKPTFLFYHPDLTLKNTSKKLSLIEGLVTSKSMINSNETQITIIKSILIENLEVINNYKFVQGHNNNIATALTEISKQGLDYLTNIT